jgi:hypothetical protein
MVLCRGDENHPPQLAKFTHGHSGIVATRSQTLVPLKFSKNHYNVTDNSANELRHQEISKSVFNNPYLMNGQTPTQLFQFGNNNTHSFSRVGVPDALSNGCDSTMRRKLSSQ